MVAAPGLLPRPCPLENAALKLRGRSPPPRFPVPSYLLRPRAPSRLIHLMSDPGQARPEPRTGREAAQAAWRRHPWSCASAGQLASKRKRPCPPAGRLCFSSGPKLKRCFLFPRTLSPPGWALASSQSPERGNHWLKGTQHTSNHSPPRSILFSGPESGT